MITPGHTQLVGIGFGSAWRLRLERRERRRGDLLLHPYALKHHVETVLILGGLQDTLTNILGVWRLISYITKYSVTESAAKNQTIPALVLCSVSG